MLERHREKRHSEMLLSSTFISGMWRQMYISVRYLAWFCSGMRLFLKAWDMPTISIRQTSNFWSLNTINYKLSVKLLQIGFNWQMKFHSKLLRVR